MPERSASMRAAVPGIRRLLPSVLFGILSAGSTVALLAASAWLITRAAEQPPIMYLNIAVVGVRAFALGRGVFRYLERLSGHDASFRQLAGIRTGVFRRMLPLAPDGLAASRRGDLLARFTRDVDELQNVPLKAVQPVVSAVVVVAAAVAGIALIAPAAAGGLAVVLVAGIALALVAQAWIGARADRRIGPLRGRLQAAVLDHVQALDVLIAFDAADADRGRIAGIDRELARAARRRAVAGGLVQAASTALGGLGAAAAIALAAPLVVDGRIDGPAFAVVCLVPLAIAEVAGAIPAAASAWRTARASARRVDRAVPAEPPAGVPAEPAEPIAAPPAAPAPALELEGVSASWPELGDGAGAPAASIAGFDLAIAPGERVLVRGASGAGKTTLAHVLVRFLDYDGSYRIGGAQAKRLAIGDVHRLVGIVEQRPWLFDESIRQNLLFAREGAGDAELLDVLGRVGLAGWVAERGGLDAPVGERGSLVSGGQAQRIALARAMLAGFPVLVLDEPTANVDRARADALVDELLTAAEAPGRTLVLIAHAEVDESRFDRVVRIEGGRLLA
ncbi:thiol reductant ABC exporter subunit CydC [Agromyces archimandritae]|uniref:Thiol reductant ABC exporter subunit CydC n=1 Tax=Agromyces archimandritae TaxID=2781962 RepID=A0A975INS3_9MICO|nr:thiol reductant ABC exporter subunit CydC [Agromyces archimandritae]QTX04882.1 thiol reductant ABC exporter subunit CydC [Agromyces archimandritae]